MFSTPVLSRRWFETSRAKPIALDVKYTKQLKRLGEGGDRTGPFLGSASETMHENLDGLHEALWRSLGEQLSLALLFCLFLFIFYFLVDTSASAQRRKYNSPIRSQPP